MKAQTQPQMMIQISEPASVAACKAVFGPQRFNTSFLPQLKSSSKSKPLSRGGHRPNDK